MEAAETIKGFTDFFQNNCLDKIASAFSFFEVDFNTLSKWSIDIANELLENPEEAITAAELAVEQLTIADGKKLSIWFIGLPKAQQRNVWEVRKDDIGKMVGLKGIINKASGIKYVCKVAKFDCPSCGNAVNIIQMDEKFKEATKCACGRKGQMRLLDKVMVNTIKLGLIDDLMEKENIDRSIAREKLCILSGDDLTSYDVDKRIKPGRKVVLNGYFKYAQKFGSTEFDSIFQVNSIEFVQVGWDTVEISKGEEEQIKKMLNQ